MPADRLAVVPPAAVTYRDNTFCDLARPCTCTLRIMRLDLPGAVRMISTGRF
jgi:hypothetical protein